LSPIDAADFQVTTPVAVVVARGGRMPVGADEAVAEAGGVALVVGDGAKEASTTLPAAVTVNWCDTGVGLRPGALSSSLATVLGGAPLVVLPASPDGRDLAPRLAAALGRPLLAGAVSVGWDASTGRVSAQLSRLEGTLLVGATANGPAVATLLPGVRSVPPADGEPQRREVTLPAPSPDVVDVEVVEVVEPDPSTMDLGDAVRVLGGGAGLVARDAGEAPARGTFALLSEVAAALGASAGATRVVTDAGWLGYDRQIGTTGVAVDPELYIAFGVSGASQHTGGLGAPRHVVSVNLDPSCPMTAMADLGLVTDARALLVELARRLGVAIPEEVGRV
jgi:electron transfer flavoprotein alpha subunit